MREAGEAENKFSAETKSKILGVTNLNLNYFRKGCKLKLKIHHSRNYFSIILCPLQLHEDHAFCYYQARGEDKQSWTLLRVLRGREPSKNCEKICFGNLK